LVRRAPREVNEDLKATHGWCSLRLRFEQRELELIKGAEQLRGASLARTPRPEVLRNALSLAKAGQKVGAAAPGASISLEEQELGLLIDALRFASSEVQFAARVDDGTEADRHDAVMRAFPELVEKGVWRSFGLVRELDGLAARLSSAVNS
jgi:hypothetical protein